MKKRYVILVLMVWSVIMAVVVNEDRREIVRNDNYVLAFDVFKKEGVDLDKYLEGIDFNKPVSIYHVKKSDIFIQYQTLNSPQGNFYAFEGSTPSSLGISDQGWDEKSQSIVDKEMRVYVATKDFDALMSYAAPVVDDWSTPEIETQTEGHDRQLFTTCKECFTFVDAKPRTIYYLN